MENGHALVPQVHVRYWTPQVHPILPQVPLSYTLCASSITSSASQVHLKCILYYLKCISGTHYVHPLCHTKLHLQVHIMCILYVILKCICRCMLIGKFLWQPTVIWSVTSSPFYKGVWVWLHGSPCRLATRSGYRWPLLPTIFCHILIGGGGGGGG